MFLYLIAGILFVSSCTKTDIPARSADSVRSLKFERSIALSVSGRIDHFSIDHKRNRLFVAALGNNSVEVIDLNTSRVIQSIHGLDEPQGVQYADDKLFIANGGSGECLVFDAANLKRIQAIALGDDADNIRYDSMQHHLYVGYGEGGIAVIDTRSLDLLAKIALPAHPEAFEIDPSGSKLFVNIPDAREIGVVDLRSNKVVGRLQTGSADANFPMAFDRERHLLFAGCRSPSSVVVLDLDNGKVLQQISIGADVDDLFLDPDRQHLLASCGDGEIDILDVAKLGHLSALEKIETRSGARTSFLDTASRRLFVALPKRDDLVAELRVYSVR